MLLTIDTAKESRADVLRVIDAAYGKTEVKGAIPKPRANGNGKSKAKRNGKHDTAAIRAWALNEGYDIGATGRLPFDVIEAFGKAHR